LSARIVPGGNFLSEGYKWKEIADLPEDLDALRDRELEALREVWSDERKRIDEAGQVSDFSVQLAREWAIETGIIEGVYTLDRGVTQTLIERGIDSSYIAHDSTNRDPELVARIIQAHAEVLEGLFAFVKGERPLGTSYIKELHQALLRNIDTVVVFDPSGQAFETPLEKGAYKRMPNNPRRPDGEMHEYCPPEHVASEMDRLIGLHQAHERRGVGAHIEAAWVHHAFTQIHPFQDGNGRVARALASLVFIKDGFFPLVVTRDDREKYIGALERADQSDLAGLVGFFARIQKRVLTRAIGRAVEIRPVHSVEQALVATRDMLVNVGRIAPANVLVAKNTAVALAQYTKSEFERVVTRLTRDIAQASAEFHFQVASGKASERYSRASGEAFQYDPNTKDFDQAVLLTLAAGGVSSRIVVSFHGVGPAFRGLLVAAGFFHAGETVQVLTGDAFRISYQESQQGATTRYSKWLGHVLIEGLAQWRRSLV
jgi:Fic family protein